MARPLPIRTCAALCVGLLVAAASPPLVSRAGSEESLTTGRVSVLVTRNGRLSTARVAVHTDPGDEMLVESTTGTSPATNPVVLEVAPGVRRVIVESLEHVGQVDHLVEDVRVTSGRRVALSHDFASGTLNIRAVLGGLPIDSAVTVRTTEGRAIAERRTGGQDLDIELSPGDYEVGIAPASASEGFQPQVASAVEILEEGLVVLDLELVPGLPQAAP